MKARNSVKHFYSNEDTRRDAIWTDPSLTTNRLHSELAYEKEKDVSGGVLTTDEKAAPAYDGTSRPSNEEFDDGSECPTEEEIKTLRHVPYSKLKKKNAPTYPLCNVHTLS